ncbi:MAG: hypothetical protein KDD02_11835 [Phaeodactylibacter sp.]|nr:hypothetical protein [Phaeodactylibacter sp.]
MRKLFLFLALALLAGGLHAQDSDKYFKKLPQEGFDLYFLSPTAFKSKPGKVRLEADYTFQYYKRTPASVDMKFSLFSKTALRSLDSLAFFAGSRRLDAAASPEIMFLQKEKGKWHSRFSTPLPYTTLQQILEAGPELKILVYSDGKAISFPAGKDWREAAAVLKEILAVEIRMGE